MADMQNEIQIPHVDGEEFGIECIAATVRADNGQVYFRIALIPDDNVQDADEGDFPDFEGVMSQSDFNKLAAMIAWYAQ